MSRISKEELKSRLAEGRNFTAEEFPEEIFELMGLMGERQLLTVDENENEESEEQEELFFRTTRKKYYNLSLTRVAWTALGVILDIYYAKGIASAALAAAGLNATALASIETSNGELCVVNQLRAEAEPKPQQVITSALKNKKCPFTDFNCTHQQNGKCKIKTEHVTRNLTTLSGKQLVKQTNGLWRSSLA